MTVTPIHPPTPPAPVQLTSPASFDLDTNAATPAQEQGGSTAAAAPVLTGPSALSEAIDAASLLASAQAVPDVLAADPADALQGAVTAAQDAAAAAQSAAVPLAAAATAIALAAGALAAATPAAQDPGPLAADATAKYLGAGFLGPVGAPNPDLSAREDLPGIAKVSAASASAPQTYSNPHDLAFGQTVAARLEALPAETGPAAAQGIDLSI